jgi:hypothetical protein
MDRGAAGGDNQAEEVNDKINRILMSPCIRR